MGAELPFDHPQFHLLRQSATIDPDSSALEAIRKLEPNIENWNQLLAEAERHGLSNLLARNMTLAGCSPPEEIHHQITALKVRHRRANETRMAALAEILESLDSAGIPSAVLKGAALVNMIYPDCELRPMGDIDILVPPSAALPAQQCLRKLGFTAEDRKRGMQSEHHHLPAALRIDRGLQVVVEIHTDAVSQDTGLVLDWDSVVPTLQVFRVRGSEAHALGDVDMLRHLCHHAFEPAETFKLIALADIYGYCHHFCERIAWDVIARRFPVVFNTLTLLGCLAPAPESIRHVLPAIQSPCPRDAGKGYPPLSTILKEDSGLLTRSRRLLVAPEWWMRCYYNVPLGQSLLPTRLLRHPYTVSRWLFRRLRAGVRDRLR
jgi:hypothetical protein